MALSAQLTMTPLLSLPGWLKPAEATLPGLSDCHASPAMTPLLSLQVPIHRDEAILVCPDEIAAHLSGARKDKRGRAHRNRGRGEKPSGAFFNSILTFECYTSNGRGNKNSL
jgi:hypothetical protein